MVPVIRLGIATAFISLFSCVSMPAALSEDAGTNFLLAQTKNPNIALAQQLATNESNANSLAIPNAVLATGTNIKSMDVSPNAMQLATQIKVLPLLVHFQELKQSGNPDRLDLLETRQQISEILRRTEVEVSFVLSEIYDEQGLYNELLSSYTSERDKIVAVTNAISFSTNGALWAIGEAFDVPTYKQPRLSIPSGTVSILAGIIPSIASMATLKEVTGRKHSAPASPNMLAKIFDRPISPQIEYPNSVWTFLDTPAASDGTDLPALKRGDNKPKKRREVIIDRWISDKNLPAFTDRSSNKQIDVLTASTEQHKTLTMGVLSTRLQLLSQLASEVFKMNRLLLELEMVLAGDKHI